MAAVAVFLPWLLLGLAVSLLLCLLDISGRIARRIKARAEFAQAVRGRGDRRYTVTFENHRGY